VAVADGLVESVDAVSIPSTLEDASVGVDRIADLGRRRASSVGADPMNVGTVDVVPARAIAGVSASTAAVARRFPGCSRARRSATARSLTAAGGARKRQRKRQENAQGLIQGLLSFEGWFSGYWVQLDGSVTRARVGAKLGERSWRSIA